MRRFFARAAWFMAGMIAVPFFVWGVNLLSAGPPHPAFDVERAAVPRPSNDEFLSEDSESPDVFGAEPTFRGQNPSVNVSRPQVVTIRTTSVRAVLLQIMSTMLAAEQPADAAEAAKLTELRAELQQVVDQKASLLNASALQAEIAAQKELLAELLALRELVALKNNLKELSDKYPNSAAGRQAVQLLKQLESSNGIPLQSTPHEFRDSDGDFSPPVRPRTYDISEPVGDN